MRYAAKVDGNQAEIVEAWRNVGAKVLDTHRIGGGFPDTIVAFRGRVYIVEIKMPGEPLTKKELEFFEKYKHDLPLFIVHSKEEGLELIGAAEYRLEK